MKTSAYYSQVEHIEIRIQNTSINTKHQHEIIISRGNSIHTGSCRDTSILCHRHLHHYVSRTETNEADHYNVTTDTVESVKFILYYRATFPDAKLWYKASVIRLKIHSNISDLSEPKAIINLGECFYMDNNKPDADKPN